jgi:hypothetical protein
MFLFVGFLVPGYEFCLSVVKMSKEHMLLTIREQLYKAQREQFYLELRDKFDEIDNRRKNSLCKQIQDLETVVAELEKGEC